MAHQEIHPNQIELTTVDRQAPIIDAIRANATETAIEVAELAPETMDEAGLGSTIEYLESLYDRTQRVQDVYRSVAFQLERKGQAFDFVKVGEQARRRVALELFQESLPEAAKHRKDDPSRPQSAAEWGEFYEKAEQELGVAFFVTAENEHLTALKEQLTRRAVELQS